MTRYEIIVGKLHICINTFYLKVTYKQITHHLFSLSYNKL